MKSISKFILWSLPFSFICCSSITKPIDGTYVEKGGSRTLIFRSDGTFHESPPVSKDPTAQGHYDLIGNKIATSYKYKDGGGPVDFERGKRIDDDTLLWDGKTFVRQPSLQANNTSSGSPSSTNGSRLAVENVQKAVDRVLDWTRKGGGATVLGIQELPQENAARADIRFNDFQYNSDTLGNPVSKDKKTPPNPDIGDPNYTRKRLQHANNATLVRRFSGKGVGILKRYNDGRWMLTEVHFDWVGVSRNIEIQ
jgi:hypothetical protein